MAHIGDHANQTLTGKIYAKGSSRQKLLFNFRRTATRSESALHVRRTYTYPGGRVAAIEKATFRNNNLVAYALVDQQTGARGELKIDGNARQGQGKVAFRYSEDGHTRTNSEIIKKPTVTNETILPYMLSHWDGLMAGKTVNARYMVIPRLETVGFSLKKDNDARWGGKPAVVIKMVPSSFFISMVIDPVYFTFDKKTRELREYSGLTTPQVKQDGKWHDLNAVTVFRWRRK